MSYTYDFPHPAVTVDIVVFSYIEQSLSVLLVQRARPPWEGSWALPGGFVEIDESLKRAAWRELREETGVHAAYLEQLYTFGHPRRDPRERVISVAYFALIPADKVEARAGSDAAEVRWCPAQELPELAFDHTKILAKALARLAAKAGYSTLPMQLLPETFTLRDLQQVYEQLLGKPLDKRNFHKRIRALNVIEKTGELRRGGAHRPAELYRLVDPNRVDTFR